MFSTSSLQSQLVTSCREKKIVVSKSDASLLLLSNVKERNVSPELLCSIKYLGGCTLLSNDNVQRLVDKGQNLSLLILKPWYLINTSSPSMNVRIDGYLDIAKNFMQTLIDIIFNKLKVATKSYRIA